MWEFEMYVLSASIFPHLDPHRELQNLFRNPKYSIPVSVRWALPQKKAD